jgi:eukaryotic-like serine/threonine-protein kinase
VARRLLCERDVVIQDRVQGSTGFDMDPSERTLTGVTIAGRYQIIGPLGSGGIGQVYSATQIGLDREVAVKVIRKGRRGDEITEKRFMREARAAGRISSPHVVTLFDFGRDQDSGLLYLAMELLEGQSLSERLDDPTLLELPQLIDIAGAIARGLRAAHEAGVLHRDLKPANVFLCTDETVKVLDFGIAKLIDDSDWEPLTQVNRILGTPVYMSPEAATRRPLGPTSDLYALGLILFEMVVGEPPFKTGNAMKTLRAQVEIPAPRLSDAAPWRAVPEELDELVAQLLEKDPEDRPRDAGWVVETLDRIRTLATSSGTRVERGAAARTEVDIELPEQTAVQSPPGYVALEDDDEDDVGGATTVWAGRGPGGSAPATQPREAHSAGVIHSERAPDEHAPTEPDAEGAHAEGGASGPTKALLVVGAVLTGLLVFGVLLALRVLFA